MYALQKFCQVDPSMRPQPKPRTSRQHYPDQVPQSHPPPEAQVAAVAAAEDQGIP